MFEDLDHSAIKNYIDNAEIWIVPMVNPDGRMHWFDKKNFSGGGRSGMHPTDNDNDGIPDYQDIDSDNDNILDAEEGNIDTDGDGLDVLAPQRVRRLAASCREVPEHAHADQELAGLVDRAVPGPSQEASDIRITRVAGEDVLVLLHTVDDEPLKGFVEDELEVVDGVGARLRHEIAGLSNAITWPRRALSEPGRAAAARRQHCAAQRGLLCRRHLAARSRVRGARAPRRRGGELLRAGRR